jgi:hypothetical protein
MEFQQRVETIWGPVDTWDASLDLHDPRGLAEKAIAVTSDTLGIGQAPSVPGGTGAFGRNCRLVEMYLSRVTRSRHVVPDFRLVRRRTFLCLKGMEGVTLSFFVRSEWGGPTSSASAGKILYWRKYNRVEVKDARYLDLDQIGGANMPQIPR